MSLVSKQLAEGIFNVLSECDWLFFLVAAKSMGALRQGMTTSWLMAANCKDPWNVLTIGKIVLEKGMTLKSLLIVVSGSSDIGPWVLLVSAFFWIFQCSLRPNETPWSTCHAGPYVLCVLQSLHNEQSSLKLQLFQACSRASLFPTTLVFLFSNVSLSSGSQPPGM